MGSQQHGDRQSAQRFHLAGEDLSPLVAQVGVLSRDAYAVGMSFVIRTQKPDPPDSRRLCFEN